MTTEETQSPAGRRSRNWRAFGIVSSILLVLLVAVFLSGGWRERLRLYLQAELSRVIGREVTIGMQSRYGSPFRFPELRVAGDGTIDTGSILILRNVKVTPSLAWFLRDTAPISLIDIESAVVTLRRDPDAGWSTGGLFPRAEDPEVAPMKEPIIRMIRFRELTIRIEQPETTVVQTLTASLGLRRHGGFAFNFELPFGDGAILRDASDGKRIDYALEFSFDTVPYLPALADIRLNAIYRSDSAVLTASVGALVNGTPAHLKSDIVIQEGDFEFDGNWEYGEFDGNVHGSVFRESRRFVILSDQGPVVQARNLNPSMESGSMTWRNARLEGPFEGPWSFTGRFAATGLDRAAEPSFARLNAAVDMQAVIETTDGLKLPIIRNLTGTLSFDEFNAGEFVARNGELAVEGSMTEVRLTGRLEAFGGTASPNRFAVKLGENYSPVSLDGRVRLDRVDGAKLGLSFDEVRIGEISADVGIDFVRTEGHWTPSRVEGKVQSAALVIREIPLQARDAELAMNRVGADYNVQAGGKISILGGGGTFRTTISRARAQRVELDVRKIPASSLGLVADHPITGYLDERTKSIDLNLLYDRVVAPGSAVVRGRISTEAFRFAAGTRQRPHDVALAFDLVLPDKEGVPAKVNSLLLEMDKGMTVVQAKDFSLGRNMPRLTVKIPCMEGSTLLDLIHAVRPDLPLSKLAVSGSVGGTIQVSFPEDATEFRPESGKYFVSMGGKLRIEGGPLDFAIDGEVSAAQPHLIVRIDRFNPKAIYEAVASSAPEMAGTVSSIGGEGAATLTIVGDDWDDINLEGVLKLSDAHIKLQKYPVAISGVTGDIPFRLRRAEKWEMVRMTMLDSRDIEVAKASYKEIVVTGIRAKTRFDEKTLRFEDATFQFAGGTGDGGMAIQLPGSLSPRFGIWARVQAFHVDRLYAMTGFTGSISGTGNGRVEMLTSESGELALSKLEAHLSIRNGVLGEELTRSFLLIPVQESNTMQGQMANEMIASIGGGPWAFESAEIDLELYPNYYNERTAMAKFGKVVKAEVVGNYSITGNVYPLARFQVLSGNVKPFRAWPFVRETFKVENMQMRLGLERIGSRFNVEESQAESETAPVAPARSESKKERKTSY